MIEETAEMKAFREAATRSWAKADAERLERMRNHPNNGTLGWWRVIGIRHGAVARASSALEAVEKAKELVESWESPEAFWIGVELPEVFPS